MKKSTAALKLRLNRDTVRLLEQESLSHVKGGVSRAACTFTACDGYANSGCPNTCLC
jgi:hypothetical protein